MIQSGGGEALALHFLAVILHWIGEVLVGVELIRGHIAGGSVQKARDAVHDGCAGVLHGRGLHHMELGIRLAGNPPVAHIAVVGSVNLSDGLLFHGDALHGFNRHHGGHADAAAGLDGLAERGGIDIVIDYVGNMLLRDGLNRKAELVADGLAGVPCIGGFKLRGMRNLLFKLIGSQVTAVRLGKRQAVLVYVVAVGTLAPALT